MTHPTEKGKDIIAEKATFQSLDSLFMHRMLPGTDSRKRTALLSQLWTIFSADRRMTTLAIAITLPQEKQNVPAGK